MTTNSVCFLVRSGLRQGRAVVRVTSNSYVNVIANSTVNSEISAANDVILGCTITGVWWSTANANGIQVKRGANTVLQLGGSGNWTAATGWQGETSYPLAANVVFVTPDTSSMLFIELTKVYAGSNPPTGTS